MVADITKLKSHPDKYLVTQQNGEKGHVDGVIENVKKITESKWAEIAAIFHDLGKINPNFQDKLIPGKIVSGYSNHAYFSAFAFFCAFACDIANRLKLSEWLSKEVSSNDLITLTVLIAKHHGNLPDYSPYDKTGSGAYILSEHDNQNLFKFLNTQTDLPINEFAFNYFGTSNFKNFLSENKVQQGYLEGLIFKGDKNINPLDFFLNSQFAFACLIQADKTDAAKFYDLIDDNTKSVATFCKTYRNQLDGYISGLNQKSLLNQLRTEIKNEAVKNIKTGLDKQRIFELTSPTGSGKTLMLLSLAAEILSSKGDFRIIYALPFLSITEQVEDEILKIFSDSQNFIQRIDSKSVNNRFSEIQETLDNNPSEEIIREISLLDFQENTFAYPLVITTFVRFFETLLSNRNAELLKLPNFSKCIFLLDEIQSLPPRLYGFFVGYLNKFCDKFNCYAIISTATQPNFRLPEKRFPSNQGNGRYVAFAKDFFPEYSIPFSLLSLDYFSNNLFNRYQIDFNKEPLDLETLKAQIIAESKSVLIILNTIDDTKKLFELLEKELSNEELLLLNTHCTPNHRKQKISIAKDRLKNDQKIVLVSTQLIEAGVDIDFPVLFRDFATVSSIIQSAGRCNRNGKLPNLGMVYLFKLTNNGKVRSDLIYRGKDKEILRFTKEVFISNNYQEKDLINLQKDFFSRIKDELNFATHSQNNVKDDFHFLKDIQECQFDKIGKFQLIDEQVFGQSFQYFVPDCIEDLKFETLLNHQKEIREFFKVKIPNKNQIRIKKKIIETHLKSMSGQIVQIRIQSKSTKPIQACTEDYFGILKLSIESYSFAKGINLEGNNIL